MFIFYYIMFYKKTNSEYLIRLSLFVTRGYSEYQSFRFLGCTTIQVREKNMLKRYI